MRLFGVAIFKNPKVALSIILQLSLLLLSFGYPFLYPKKADATLNTFYVRFDRQSATAALSGTVCMQSSQTTPGVAKVIIQFPSTFSIAGADTSWTADVTAGNLPSGATAWPVAATSTKVLAGTTSALFSVGDLAASANTYCFHFVGTGSTVGTAGINGIGQVVAYKSDAAGGAVVESGQYATAITTGVNSEQIGITASVSASFSFALSGGAAGQTLPLGVLNSGAPVTAPYQVTATISTNAHAGFLSWIKGTNTGGVLRSTVAAANMTSTLASYPTLTNLASNTGYGVFGVTGTNSPVIAPGYARTNGTTVGKVDSTQFNQLASLTGVQSNTTFNIGVSAKPASTDPAAIDYADTLTVVASGSF
jgi:hypothetical protein